MYNLMQIYSIFKSPILHMNIIFSIFQTKFYIAYFEPQDTTYIYYIMM